MSQRRKRIIIIVLVVSAIGLIFWLLSAPAKQNTNPGGSGGDYTPDGWVTLSPLPAVASLTNEQYSTITTKLSELLQAKHNEPEYTATYIEASLMNKAERSVYQSTEFDVKINQTSEVYHIKIYSDLIEGTEIITVELQT